MYTIYRLNDNELDGRFIRALKARFKNKDVEIAVCDVSEIEEDETTYLLKSPANRSHLLNAIENVDQHRNLAILKLGEL